MAVVMVLILVLVFLQYHGDFLRRARLTVMAPRAGLLMDPGSKVTYDGVQIGRVGTVDAVEVGGTPRARLTLDVIPRYLALIPRNVDATVSATTVFGNKYVSFTSPKNPSPQRITSSDVIDATSVTIEFNTLFETVLDLAQQVDPIKLNQTLSATAAALPGLGDRFGQSFVRGNQILTDINARMPQIHRDNRLLADLADVYTTAAPGLFDGLQNAATTAGAVSDRQDHLDWALMAAIGFGNTGADVFGRGGPFLVRTARDLIPTSGLLDTYSPSLFCSFRNFNDAQSKDAAIVGGNGFSIRLHNELIAAGNPYVYPDNLPRVDAHFGPEGKPGCWQPATPDLWPAPYLVMNTGASIAPYNHLGLGQPSLIDYVWGRQVGENTINP